MAHCASCDREIRWVVTERGKRMPLDAEPVPDGNVELRVLDGQETAIVHAAGQRPLTAVGPFYVSHFSTCPDAGSWRKR